MTFGVFAVLSGVWLASAVIPSAIAAYYSTDEMDETIAAIPGIALGWMPAWMVVEWIYG